MLGKVIEIDGKTYNLGNPEEKKAAIRAWLQAKARNQDRAEQELPLPGPQNPLKEDVREDSRML